jgi:hypothetical protein
MKAGLVAKITDGSGKVEEFDKEVPVEFDSFDSVEHCIEVTENIELPDGRSAQIGRAAVEDIGEEEKVQIQDGSIRQYDSPGKVTKYTTFLFVPGSFVAVGSSSGTFAFDLLSSSSGSQITTIEFDLDSFVEEHTDAEPWKVGFYENPGRAENGVVHGEQLLQSSEVTDVLAASKKNQIGLMYESLGFEIKMYTSESGYVEIYQPSNISTDEFIQYVEQDLLHHAHPI